MKNRDGGIEVKGGQRLVLKALIAFASVFTSFSVFSSVASFAGSSDVGTSGAQFLKIGPGARPAGMGEAFSAVADDVHAIYYNPAGLATLSQVEATGMHNQYFQGLDYEFGALALPVSRLKKKPADKKNGVLGFAIYNLAVSDIERRGLVETEAPLGTFESSDFAYALAYAQKLNERLSLGGSLKYIRQSLDDKSASAVAFDLGSLYRKGDWGFSLGARHLGNKVKFVNVSDPLPRIIYGGASYKVNGSVTLAADLGLPRDNDPTYAFGFEYRHSFTEKARGALRAGYNSQNDDPQEFAGFSLGLGLALKNFGLDFAWVPFGELGSTFRYSLMIKF